MYQEGLGAKRAEERGEHGLLHVAHTVKVIKKVNGLLHVVQAVTRPQPGIWALFAYARYHITHACYQLHHNVHVRGADLVVNLDMCPLINPKTCMHLRLS
jgi:hypothetical protein